MTPVEPPTPLPTSGGRAQDARPAVGLRKDRPAAPPLLAPVPPPEEPRPGPAWIVVPARVIALAVLVPLRLVHDLVVLIGRGLRALMRVPVAVLRWAGRLLGAVLGAVWDVLYGGLLAPLGRLIAAAARGLGAGLAWLARVLLIRPLGWLYRVLLTPAGRFLALLGLWLLVRPAALLWRYVLRPPLLAAAWLARGAGRVLAACWRVFAASATWSWRLLGRALALLCTALFVLPARFAWRYLLRPIGLGVAGTWRLSARVLRALWTFLVARPARWAAAVLAPVGRGVRGAWRVSVLEPARSVRRTVRETSADVRRTLRRAFGGR